jgi:hypothetical protein
MITTVDERSVATNTVIHMVWYAVIDVFVVWDSILISTSLPFSNTALINMKSIANALVVDPVAKEIIWI